MKTLVGHVVALIEGFRRFNVCINSSLCAWPCVHVLDCGRDEPFALALLLSYSSCSAFEPYHKINWQTLGVGFRTEAQVPDGIARS